MPVRRPARVGAFRERAAIYRETSVVDERGNTFAERGALFSTLNVPCAFEQMRPDQLRDLATEGSYDAPFYRMTIRGTFDFTDCVTKNVFVVWRGLAYKVIAVRQDPQQRVAEMTLARDVNFDAMLDELGLLSPTVLLERILTDGRGNDLVWSRQYAAN